MCLQPRKRSLQDVDLRALKGRDVKLRFLSFHMMDHSLCYRNSLYLVFSNILCCAAWVSQTASPSLCHLPSRLPLPSVPLSTSPRSPYRSQPRHFIPPFTSSVPWAAVPLPSARLPQASHPSAVPAVTMATSARMLCGRRMLCGMRMHCGMRSPPWPFAEGQAIQLELKQPGKGRWGYNFPPNGNLIAAEAHLERWADPPG